MSEIASLPTMGSVFGVQGQGQGHVGYINMWFTRCCDHVADRLVRGSWVLLGDGEDAFVGVMEAPSLRSGRTFCGMFIACHTQMR